MPQREHSTQVVLVTGPSGAGRTTGLHALEDLGFETIDNLPLSLIPRLVSGPDLVRPLALGVDARNRDFSDATMLGLMTELEALTGRAPTLLFIDARPEVLIRRFSETRRRHPMAPDGSPDEGVARELALLERLRPQASILIDTSDLTPHDLKARLHDWFASDQGGDLVVTLLSFSYKKGVPPGADMVFDCRFLKNPHWQQDLRPLTGLTPQVQGYVTADPAFQPFFEQLCEMVGFLLPAFKAEGKSHLTIGFGCTGGKHRSVSVAEILAESLANKGWQVSKQHREVGQRATRVEKL